MSKRHRNNNKHQNNAYNRRERDLTKTLHDSIRSDYATKRLVKILHLTVEPVVNLDVDLIADEIFGGRYYCIGDEKSAVL